MLQQLLSPRANSSVKKYLYYFKGFRTYLESKGIILSLPYDSLLVYEYLSCLHDAKNSYAVLSTIFIRARKLHSVDKYKR